jgi:hypothetical protein
VVAARRVGPEGVIVTAQADDDARATVRSKGLAVMPDGTTGTVTYADEVVRTPTGRRIAHRKVIPASQQG